MALPIIENIAAKSGEAIKALILEQNDQIRKDFNYLLENAPENKKVVLRMTHTITLDLDTSEQKDVLAWSLSRKAETSSNIPETPTGGQVGDSEEGPDTDFLP